MMPRPLPWRETRPAYPGSMDEVRQALAATTASLAKLQLRLYRKMKSARRIDSGTWDKTPRWVLADFDPPSQWLQGAPSGMPLESIVQSIMETQMYLTAIIAHPGEVDLKLVCRALQHMSGDPHHWSDAALRFAKRFEVSLDPNPMVEFNYADLFCTSLPGQTYPKKPTDP